MPSVCRSWSKLSPWELTLKSSAHWESLPSLTYSECLGVSEGPKEEPSRHLYWEVGDLAASNIFLRPSMPDMASTFFLQSPTSTGRSCGQWAKHQKLIKLDRQQGPLRSRESGRKKIHLLRETGKPDAPAQHGMPGDLARQGHRMRLCGWEIPGGCDGSQSWFPVQGQPHLQAPQPPPV